MSNTFNKNHNMNPVDYSDYEYWEFSLYESLFTGVAQLLRTRQRTTEITLPPVSTENYSKARKLLDSWLTQANYKFSIFNKSQVAEDLFLGVNLEVPRNPNKDLQNSALLNACFVNQVIQEAETRPLDLVLSVVFSKIALLMCIVKAQQFNTFELEGIPSIHLNNVTSKIRDWLQQKKYVNIRFQHPPATEDSEIMVLAVFFDLPKEPV